MAIVGRRTGNVGRQWHCCTYYCRVYSAVSFKELEMKTWCWQWHVTIVLCSFYYEISNKKLTAYYKLCNVIMDQRRFAFCETKNDHNAHGENRNEMLQSRYQLSKKARERKLHKMYVTKLKALSYQIQFRCYKGQEAITFTHHKATEDRTLGRGRFSLWQHVQNRLKII
jgi:hypothetical protein